MKTYDKTNLVLRPLLLSEKRCDWKECLKNMTTIRWFFFVIYNVGQKLAQRHKKEDLKDDNKQHIDILNIESTQRRDEGNGSTWYTPTVKEGYPYTVTSSKSRIINSRCQDIRSALSRTQSVNVFLRLFPNHKRHILELILKGCEYNVSLAIEMMLPYGAMHAGIKSKNETDLCHNPHCTSSDNFLKHGHWTGNEVDSWKMRK